MKCRLCGKEVGTNSGMVTHLKGQMQYDGHNLTHGQAEFISSGGVPRGDEANTFLTEYPDSLLSWAIRKARE